MARHGEHLLKHPSLHRRRRLPLHHGFRPDLVGHRELPRGNYSLANIVQEGNANGKKMALFPTGTDWADARQSAGLATSNHEDMHAGEFETSILLHAHPELVRDGYQAADWTADDRRHLLTTGMGEYTHNGVIGRPSLASAEKGKAVLASLVERFASVLEVLQR